MKKIMIFIMIFVTIIFMIPVASAYSGGIGDYSDIVYPASANSGDYFEFHWRLTNIGYDDALWTEVYRGTVLIKSYDCELLMRGGAGMDCFAGDTITTTSTYTIKVGGFLGEGWNCNGRQRFGTGYTQFTVFVNSLPSNPVTCWKCNLLNPESTIFPSGTICGQGVAIGYPYSSSPHCTALGPTYCWRCVNGEPEAHLFGSNVTCGQGEALEYPDASEPSCLNSTPGFELSLIFFALFFVYILMRRKK